MSLKFATLTTAALLGFALALPAGADEKLKSVIDDPARPADEKARDQYRHPSETLAFFGIAPDMTVVELAPGGGWSGCVLMLALPSCPGPSAKGSA